MRTKCINPNRIKQDVERLIDKNKDLNKDKRNIAGIEAEDVLGVGEKPNG